MENVEKRTSWLDRSVFNLQKLNWEHALFAIILIVALITRVYDLGLRVMSHDETSHVYFSWLFEQGNGYSHDPVTHGPFQFHAIALTYYLFGSNDFTSRLPAALFSFASVAFLWYYRRYLGRAGALIGAVLMTISPYMLYYGRYARNEAFVNLWGLLTLWAMLRYFDTGKPAYLYALAAAVSLHFASKETAFIYTAQALVFLAVVLVIRLSTRDWPHPEYRNRFLIALIIAALLMGTAGGVQALQRAAPAEQSTETVAPAVPGQEDEGAAPSASPAASRLPLVVFAAAGLVLLGAAYIAIRGYTWEGLRQERSFDLAIVLGTMVLPMLAPFPVKMLGINPISYTDSQTIILDAIFVAIFALAAIGIGWLWNRKIWLVSAAIFYGIFTVLYTSIFTNGFGFITGLVGSLGYWVEQQAVNRGSQPWYYYGLIQVPIYEFLPAIGSLAALLWLLVRRNASVAPIPTLEDNDLPEVNPPESRTIHDQQSTISNPLLPIALFGFWSLTSLLAYSIAGEKMPWLTLHISLPMIVVAAWFLGRMVETTHWNVLRTWSGWLVILVLPVFFLSLLATVGSLMGGNPPFQGKELAQLQATSTFLTALLTAAFSGWGMARLVRDWQPTQFYRLVLLVAFALLAVITARAAWRASFINYDNATEYLVYAHMAPGPKQALQQIEEISRRTTNGLGMRVAYDDDTTYPYWWYLRDYTNKDYFAANPTRAQREAVAILVGDKNYGKIEPVVGQAYNMFEFTRIWWPNQDYFGLTWDRLFDALTDPQMRAAVFDVWMNRDYTLYSQLTNTDMSLQNWTPNHKFRLYIRKDVIASLWNYGVSPTVEEVVADPYEGKGVSLEADYIVGSTGSEPGQFMRPRGIALAADGSLYVADTENHRIQHLGPDGSLLKGWGSFAASTESVEAPPGTFNEPWGIAVAPDGSVYVADTWNNRIQKFTPDGEFVTSWGYGISQTEDPFGFYGPRAVAVDPEGRVLVTDTGNKRVVVFDADGNFLTQFGQAGLLPGEFDEPVGLATDALGQVFVADTWNQRIQVFLKASDGSYSPLTSWDVVAWYGQSLDNKPFIAVYGNSLFAVDPEGYRILEFTTAGDFVRYWGEFGVGAGNFDLPGAVAAGPTGIWVSDTNNSRLLHFTLP